MTRLATIDREAVLDAAEKITAEKGPAGLTLDAVAVRTGVSKGGLQYAFKSKDGLIAAMVRRYVEAGCADLGKVAAETDASARMAKWLRLLTKVRPSTEHVALLAAVVQNPRLLDGAAASYRTQIEQLAGRDLPVERVWALTLAADGLALGELIGLVRLSAAERKRVVREIQALASHV